MRRTILIVIGIAGSVVALLLIAVAIVIWGIDPKTLVAPVQARIKEATGREVTIRGDVGLTLSLTPKLVIHDLALANAPGARTPQMVVAKELDVEFALLPLLHRRFEANRIDLIEPVIALETDAQGHVNWDFAGTPGRPAPPAGAAETPAVFGVGNVAITNGSLTYSDGKTGAVTKVAIDSLALSSPDAQSPVNAEFRGTIDDAAVKLTGTLGPMASLLQRRWPYPVSIAGEIDGEKAGASAKLRVDGDTVNLDEFEIAFGSNVVKGTVAVTRDGARPRYVLALTSPVITLAHLPTNSDAHAKVAGGKGAAPPSRFLFSERPLPLAVLRTVDASGEMKIGRLVVPPTREFTALDIRFTLQDGHLAVPTLKAATFGGSIDAKVTLAVPVNGSPTLALVLDSRNLNLGAELAALDVRRDVKGGKTAVKADLRAHGSSLHEWAASLSGNFTATAGPATIANAQLDLGSSFDLVAKAVNPFREKDPNTELKCAVIRLPFVDGVAHADRSVAVETQKLGVSVSGSLDLRQEFVDFSFRPKLREGIPIDIPQIAELVRLRGPMRHPQVTIDAMGSVTTAARIGAAISTGGISELGVALFGAAERGGPGPCAVALGASSGKAENKAAETKQGTDPVNKALGKLFGR
jgi:AsmA family protein